MRDRKLHYFWGSWKNPSFRGGFTKNQYIGGFCKRIGVAWTIYRFKGGLGKKERSGVFEWGRGVDTPIYTMV